MSNQKISLNVDKRDITGKKVAQLRKSGQTPGIVYGGGMEPVSVKAASPEVEKVYRNAGKNHPVHLKVGGKARIAMIKNIDVDPVKRKVRHIAFHAVDQNVAVEAEVPVRLVGEGESAAEKAGLVVLQTVDNVAVKALPMELPDAIEVSIVDLADVGQHITVGDLKLPEGVELAHAENADELVIASVYEPSALQAANESAGGEAGPDDVANVDSEQGEDTDYTAQNEAAREAAEKREEKNG